MYIMSLRSTFPSHSILTQVCRYESICISQDKSFKFTQLVPFLFSPIFLTSVRKAHSLCPLPHLACHIAWFAELPSPLAQTCHDECLLA